MATGIQKQSKVMRERFVFEVDTTLADYPIPIARSVYHDNQSVVLVCPYCGANHFHSDDDGKLAPGHRVQHCSREGDTIPIYGTADRQYLAWRREHPEIVAFEKQYGRVGYVIRPISSPLGT